jgi:hypothetical protein
MSDGIRAGLRAGSYEPLTPGLLVELVEYQLVADPGS